MSPTAEQQSDEAMAAAWAAEIERREAAAVAGGGADSRDWHDVLADIERKILNR